MAENVIENIISWETTGIEETLKNSAAVKSAMQDTSKAINEADAALGDLNQGVSSFKPLPFDDIISPAIPKLKEAGTEAQEALNKTSGKLFDAGNATSFLSSTLDKAVPGLGQITQSLLSFNPVAVAGTVAIAAVTAVFADMQQKADAAKKAADEAVKAESDRAVAQMDLQQKTNSALAGNIAARQAILQEYAALYDKHADIEADDVAQNKIKIDAEAELARQTAIADEARRTQLGGYVKVVNDANAAAEVQRGIIQKATENLDANTKAMAENGKSMASYEEATKKLGITQKETEAVQLGLTQGAEGANAALEKLNENLETGKDNFGKLGDTLLDTFKNVGESVKNTLEKAAAEKLKQQAEERTRAEEDLAETSAKLTEVESSRGKALADRVIEEQRAAEMGALQDRLTAAQAYDAAREKNKKIAEIQKQADDAETAAQQKRMADEQKLLANYIKAESEATADYNRDRVRKLRDLYNTLQGLAAAGDVAGFVNARRSGLQGIADSDDDAGVAARKRRDAFNQQQKELEDSFRKETETRRQQNQQKLAQERDSGQQEIKQADIVRKQIADLQAQWAKRDLEARRAAEDASYRQTVDVLVKKRNDELKITAGAAAGVIGFFSDMARAAAQLRGFGQQITMRGGTSSAGAASSAASPVYMRGGTQQQANYTIENVNVGKVASPADIAQAVQGLVNGIQKLAQGR